MPTIVHSSRQDDGTVLIAIKSQFGYVVQRESGTVRHVEEVGLTLAAAREKLGISTQPSDRVLSRREKEYEAARDKAARHARGGK